MPFVVGRIRASSSLLPCACALLCGLFSPNIGHRPLSLVPSLVPGSRRNALPAYSYLPTYIHTKVHMQHDTGPQASIFSRGFRRNSSLSLTPPRPLASDAFHRAALMHNRSVHHRLTVNRSISLHSSGFRLLRVQPWYPRAHPYLLARGRVAKRRRCLGTSLDSLSPHAHYGPRFGKLRRHRPPPATLIPGLAIVRLREGGQRETEPPPSWVSIRRPGRSPGSFR
ncbi:hypothetical protein LX36DRAFT_448705 [Colletotrichum falcatum]|nr:hypothetical protein LX36DRAFT_448705 [Colletotrichum falcatum]